MANIYVEAKGPQGIQAKESLLPAAVDGYSRGLAVQYGADAYHCELIAAAGASIMGIIEEDAIDPLNPVPVIEFGQAVAKIGANVSRGQALATNAAGALVPQTEGQPVVAISMEDQVYVAPGSYACVFVLGLLSMAALP